MNQKYKNTVLVVDDEAANLGVLFEFLRGADYKVLVAEDGASALDIVNRSRPDIILLDVKMPDMDGFEVYEQLQERGLTTDITVIFLSVMSEAETIAKGLDLNAVDYITKPFQPQEVVARVEKHLTLQNLRKQLEVQNAQLQEEMIERARAEAEKEINRQIVRATLDGMQDPVMLIGKDYQIQWANKAMYDQYATDVDQKPLFCYQISHGQDEPCSEATCVCPLKKVSQTGHSITVLHEHVQKDGDKRYIELTASPLLDDDGKFTSMVEVSRDITERMQIESALAEKTSYLDYILSSATEDAIVTTDLDFRITYFNPLAEKFYGISADEAIGKHISEIRDVNPSDEAFGQGLGNLHDLGEHRYETVIEIDGQPCNISSRLSGIFNQEGDLIGYARFSRDITETLRAEKALRDLAVHEERRRVARDLHDSVIQSIHSTSMSAKTARYMLDKERYQALPGPLEIIAEGTRQTHRRRAKITSHFETAELIGVWFDSVVPGRQEIVWMKI